MNILWNVYGRTAGDQPALSRDFDLENAALYIESESAGV
jgi:hypothetical protein